MFVQIFKAVNAAWISCLSWWDALISGSGGLPYWISVLAFVMAIRFILMPFSAQRITGLDEPAKKSKSNTGSDSPGYSTYTGRWIRHDGY